MLRSILAIIASYIAMFVLFMAIFAGLYVALGSERVFQTDSYLVSSLWLTLTLLASFCVSVFGGWLCVLISKSLRTGEVFAVVVLVIFSVSCVLDLRSKNPDAPNVRAGEVGFQDGIRLAVTPVWLHIVNPIVAGLGAFVGARIRRRNGSAETA